MEKELDDDSESIITNERYEYIAKVMKACVRKKKKALTTSDKIDRIVTNRWLALPIFVAVMFVVYYVSVSSLGTIVTDFTNDTLFAEWIQPPVGEWLSSIGAADWLNGLIVDGIIGGVGAVLGFVPKCLFYSSSSPFWRTAAIWPASPSLWTVSSVNSAFPAKALSQC